MLLYFVRHGLATWPLWTGDDSERPLTAEGVRRMEAAAMGLKRRGVQPESILHSPLLRARQTAEIIATHLDRLQVLQPKVALAPGFDHPSYLALQAETGETLTSLMIVGHNPDMADVVLTLTGQSVLFREGTVACISSINGRHTLEWSATPDELATR
jgi:phosphohistidine phosphatase